MKQYGLIGYPLSHSFSKKYFSEKFSKENIIDSQYELYEVEKVDQLNEVLEKVGSNLKGLNVTIPHKQSVIPLLDEMDPAAKRIGAVNVIKINNGILKGYNSDYFGFKKSLEELLKGDINLTALVLGTGGASKAVVTALEDLNISYQYVSRTSGKNIMAYDEINNSTISNNRLIINCTPLGMHPNINNCPSIPYKTISNKHYLFDLVYNPEETLFMKKGLENKAQVKNGLDMLIYQAEKAWEIWNE